MANYKLTARWSLLADDERQGSIAFTAEPSASEGAVETRFDALWNAVRGVYSAEQVALTGYSWYEGVVAGDGPGSTWYRIWGDSFRVTDRQVPGTSFASQLPPQVAVVISFPMPLSARRHRGRFYMPAPTTAALQAGGWFSAETLFADAWEAFLEGCIADGWQPVVVSISNGSLAFLPITEVRVDNSFDTQRRRKRDPSNSVSRTIGAP